MVVGTVGLVATQTSGVAAYPVAITVTGNPPGLHDRAGAQVSIVVQEHDGVLLVPSAAVHQQDGGSVVYEMQAGEQVSVPVTVGIVSGGRTEITSGVTAGDTVVLPAGSPPGTTTGTGSSGLFGGAGGGGFGSGVGRGSGGMGSGTGTVGQG